MMICRECSEEVKYGVRMGTPGWHHRFVADHTGIPVTPPETFEVTPIPSPESECEPLRIEDLRPRSGPRMACNTIIKAGWDLVRLTKSRGPYLGADGSVLSTSDSLVVGARGPERIGCDYIPIAVASWRDYGFDFAYVGELRGRDLSLRKVNNDGLKQWIKGIECDESA